MTETVRSLTAATEGPPDPFDAQPLVAYNIDNLMGVTVVPVNCELRDVETQWLTTDTIHNLEGHR